MDFFCDKKHVVTNLNQKVKNTKTETQTKNRKLKKLKVKGGVKDELH